MVAVRRALLGLLCSCIASGELAGRDTPPAPELDGMRAAYNLDLDQARQYFRAAASADPANPAAYRAVASTYLLDIAVRRGAVTSDDLLGEMSSEDRPVRPVSPELAEAFYTNAQRALALAEARLEELPNDADPHYQVGAAIALLASYAASVEGHMFGAFRFARRAYKESREALAIDPRRADAGLIVGAYQYLLSTHGMAVRWFARLAGVESDKAHGIRLVESAAHYAGENQTDARLVLEVIYNRERRYADALAVLSDLRASYPRNRFLWLEAGGTALRAHRLEEAEQLLDEGLLKLADDPRPRAYGEEALWYYKRGAVRILLHRPAEASADLQRALSFEARDRVRGRVYTELGKLADLASDRAAAIREYRMAVRIAKVDGDTLGLAEAQRLANSPYRQ